MLVSLDGKISMSNWREFKVNQNKRFSLKISDEFGIISDAKLIIYKFHTPRKIEISLKEVKESKSINSKVFLSDNVSFSESGLYFFCVSIIVNNKEIYIKADKEWNPVITTEDLPYYSFVITKTKFEVPNWAKGAQMMQIIIDRFCRDTSFSIFKMERRSVHENWNELPIWQPNAEGIITNTDFFAGNIRGLISKLDYIKSLNIDIIYLTPILQSQSNHRYDTADYEKIDVYAGEISEMKELCDKAHKLGIRIILDTVINHTGNDSRYFNEYGTYMELGAYQSKESKYYNWYKKINEHAFMYWWNFKNLPECDTNSLEWQIYLFAKGGIIDKWFSWGIDGLRIDVADELSDNFLEKLKIAVNRNKKDAYIIGEVWENAITKKKEGKVREYLHGKSLSSVMNYPFTDAILKYIRFGDSNYFKHVFEEISMQYPKQAMLSAMNSLSTHDITRAITTLVGDAIEYNKYEWTWDIGNKDRKWQFEHDILKPKQYEQGKKMFKIATVIQFFLPGNPCIFYGDEVGLHGYKDPFNRKPYPWGKEDKELLSFFIELSNARSKLQNLRKSGCRILEIDEKILILERSYKKSRILVAINRSQEYVEFKEDLSGFNIRFSIGSSTNKRLSPYGAIILEN